MDLILGMFYIRYMPWFQYWMWTKLPLLILIFWTKSPDFWPEIFLNVTQISHHALWTTLPLMDLGLAGLSLWFSGWRSSWSSPQLLPLPFAFLCFHFCAHKFFLEPLWIKSGCKTKHRSFSLFLTSTIIPLFVLRGFNWGAEVSLRIPSWTIQSTPSASTSWSPFAQWTPTHACVDLDRWHLPLNSYPSSSWGAMPCGQAAQ